MQEIFSKAFETQGRQDVDQKLKEHLGEAGAKLAMQNLEAFSADVARAAKTLYDTAVNHWWGRRVQAVQSVGTGQRR